MSHTFIVNLKADRFVPDYGVHYRQKETCHDRAVVSNAEELSSPAHILVELGCPLTVYQPPELRDKLRVPADRT